MIKEAELDPNAERQIPILAQDYLDGDSICKGEPVYVAALVKRDTTDVDMDENVHTMYGHPIDGLVEHVDLTNRKLLKLVDTGHTHIPMESGDYLDPKVTGPMRNRHEAAAYQAAGGGQLHRQGQHLIVPELGDPRRLHDREGLKMHDISFSDRGRDPEPRVRVRRDGGALRRALAHALLAELLRRRRVPLANALVQGCDCLGSIDYLDATVVDDFCEPFVIKNATCMYEEDFGTLGKHTDVPASPLTATVRHQHRFVVSFVVTVGNYRYGFYWYFYLDGRDELDCGHGYLMDCGHGYQMGD
ncbi:hypothetical protein PF008_g23331 [Phytophthora fragariae]|uniref:Amine oxidase n=1 Tax=Phytophthora fragariae TaxID=53985 RepID=A0A6G0QR39_9STRA|nr:hypothetical protein PF008_g23331 [Phytophthora fragariae]